MRVLEQPEAGLDKREERVARTLALDLTLADLEVLVDAHEDLSSEHQPLSIAAGVLQTL